jgi:prepilin-type N-terminal cleavage/methylation domain-containing protein
MIVFRNRSNPFISSERSESRNEKKTSRFGLWPHSKRTGTVNPAQPTLVRAFRLGKLLRAFSCLLALKSCRLTKTENGFTLIEVLLAMAIIALVLTPIFSIQLAVMRGNSRASQALSRIFLAKQFLVENEFQLKPAEQEKKIEKKIEKPATTLIYALKRIPENSALKKFKDVLIESVLMQWVDRQGKKRQERLVTFVYQPEVKT